jgi:hypothetical protein
MHPLRETDRQNLTLLTLGMAPNPTLPPTADDFRVINMEVVMSISL